MNLFKINVVQTMFLFMLAVGITNHVLIVPLILSTSYRDAWISALLVIPPVLLWTVILYFVMKNTEQQSLHKWFKTNYNSWVAWMVILPLLLFAITICFITVRDTSSWTKVTYLPRTPFPVTVSLYMLFGILAAYKGLRTLTIAAGILLPGVLVFGFFVMSVNYQFKDYSYLFPVFTKGVGPILHGSVYALGGLVEFALLLCIQQHLSKKVRISTLIIMTMAVTGLIFGPLMASIAIFGPAEAADQRYPAFEQWRMVLIGKFIAHLDFLSIYQWMSGSLTRISLALFIFFDLLQLNKSRYKLLWMFLTCIPIVVLVCQNKLSDPIFYRFLHDVYFPWTFAVFYAFPFILLLLILIKRGKTA
ncbi:GerAB/ArcD/ProY family transporter [Cohnella endophytica]|nr:endospore germination permease [Cohnella endophytica]